MWTEQDKQDYVQHLKREVREENKKPVTIAKMFNLSNLHADLNNLEPQE